MASPEIFVHKFLSPDVLLVVFGVVEVFVFEVDRQPCIMAPVPQHELAPVRFVLTVMNPCRVLKDAQERLRIPDLVDFITGRDLYEQVVDLDALCDRELSLFRNRAIAFIPKRPIWCPR